MRDYLFCLFLRDLRTLAAEGGGGGGAGGGDAGAGDAGAGDGGAAAAAAAAGSGGDAGGGGSGGGAENPYSWWNGDMPAEVREYLDAKHFDQPSKLYKSLRAAESAIRGNHIPGPPDNPDKVDEWFRENVAKRLGVPEKADGYALEAPAFAEGVGEYVSFDDARKGRFAEVAHKLALTPAQAKGLLDFYAAETSTDYRAFTDAAAADETEMQSSLQREWGTAYQQNLNAALEVAREVGLTESQAETLRIGKVAGSATLTKILHELAVVRGNDSLRGGGRGGVPAMTRESAQRELEQFTAKNAAALAKGDHPEHDWAMGELQRLKRAAGRGSVGQQGA